MRKFSKDQITGIGMSRHGSNERENLANRIDCHLTWRRLSCGQGSSKKRDSKAKRVHHASRMDRKDRKVQWNGKRSSFWRREGITTVLYLKEGLYTSFDRPSLFGR